MLCLTRQSSIFCTSCNTISEIDSLDLKKPHCTKCNCILSLHESVHGKTDLCSCEYCAISDQVRRNLPKLNPHYKPNGPLAVAYSKEEEVIRGILDNVYRIVGKGESDDYLDDISTNSLSENQKDELVTIWCVLAISKRFKPYVDRLEYYNKIDWDPDACWNYYTDDVRESHKNRRYSNAFFYAQNVAINILK
jgi:hypothetical protein